MVWEISRKMCYMLRAAAKVLVSLLVVMLTIFFVFGVIGVTLFKNGATFDMVGGEYEDLNMGNYLYKYANFEDLQNAFVLLTQAFLGEAFHELMNLVRVAWGTNGLQRTDFNEQKWEEALKKIHKTNYAGVWFIIVFFFLMSVLFNNLFFGLLLNTFSDLYEAQQDGQVLNKELIKSVRNPSMDEEIDEDEIASTMSYRSQQYNEKEDTEDDLKKIELQVIEEEAHVIEEELQVIEEEPVPATSDSGKDKATSD